MLDWLGNPTAPPPKPGLINAVFSQEEQALGNGSDTAVFGKPLTVRPSCSPSYHHIRAKAELVVKGAAEWRQH